MARDGGRTTQRRFQGIRGRSASRGRNAADGNNPNHNTNTSNNNTTTTNTTPSKGDKNHHSNPRAATPNRIHFKFKKLLPSTKTKTKNRQKNNHNHNHPTSASPVPDARKLSSASNSDADAENVVITPKQKQRSMDTSASIDPVSTSSAEDARQDKNVNHHHPNNNHNHHNSNGNGSAPVTPQQAKTTKRAESSAKKIHHESERDGFCRRVDYYDGTTIKVDGISTYSVGNYLGGGVAGVVYEGKRLRPPSEYPARPAAFAPAKKKYGIIQRNHNSLLEQSMNIQQTTSDDVNEGGCAGMFCGQAPHDGMNEGLVVDDDLHLEVDEENSMAPLGSTTITNPPHHHTNHNHHDIPDNDLMKDETVAIKILNPVGFRLATGTQCASAIVVREGAEMSADVRNGIKPMKEKHVWWLVNPASRSSKSLKNLASATATASASASGPNGSSSSSSSRPQGSKQQGIKVSLIAAYMDPRKNVISELPLIRCIEIWGHAPFGSSEQEFEQMMDAIERVNSGHSVNKNSPNLDPVGEEEEPQQHQHQQQQRDQELVTQSGLYRAANAQKSIQFCKELNAYVNVPAVPPRYIRWLRQRRAVTKEIRNMMLIGRHKNVVHLFEVLELVQESKSTMFLVLELVRGGELFDLISSNTAMMNLNNEDVKHLGESERNEYAMLKYFKELSAGIAYCHANGIAHRDLKPENLLVHNDASGECTLKIADFGLSATFGLTTPFDGLTTPSNRPESPSPISGLSPLFRERLTLQAIGQSALSFLTCGGVEQINECFVPYHKEPRTAASLNRMTSIVGSPHYVAPEIISQSDDKMSISSASYEIRGYDGTKADVWSAGVILYAMLFRSLPFGEDLLRCPRYESFTKWYKEARKIGGRRSSSKAALRKIDDETNLQDLGPEWFFPSKSSPESKDIIVAMLNPEPSERLSIRQVLMHPWMFLKFVP